MFDAHAIARRVTDAGIAPDHADAIVDAVAPGGRTRRRRRGDAGRAVNTIHKPKEGGKS